jgi:hypothetical protein
MNVQNHWEKVYREKAPEAVSWYRPHLETSLELIERIAPERSACILDVGGGESTLVDDLLARGYQNICVLDVWVRCRNSYNGSPSMSPKPILRQAFITSGTTALSFTFLRASTTARLTFSKWPNPSSPAVTCW